MLPFSTNVEKEIVNSGRKREKFMDQMTKIIAMCLSADNNQEGYQQYIDDISTLLKSHRVSYEIYGEDTPPGVARGYGRTHQSWPLWVLIIPYDARTKLAGDELYEKYKKTGVIIFQRVSLSPDQMSEIMNRKLSQLQGKVQAASTKSGDDV